MFKDNESRVISIGCLVVILAVVALFVLSILEGKKEQARLSDAQGTVTMVRVIFEEKKSHASGGDPVADAIGGAIIGKVFFNAPKAGAIVGAMSSSDSNRQVKTTNELTLCEVEILPDGELQPKSFIFNWGDSMKQCALLRVGDIVHLIRRTKNPGDEKSARTYQLKDDGSPWLLRAAVTKSE